MTVFEVTVGLPSSALNLNRDTVLLPSGRDKGFFEWDGFCSRFP